MKIHFITYGDDKFAKSKERIQKEAINFGEFDSVESFGPEDLHKDFQKEYADILSAQRGGGYWIWKPQIIKQKLEKMDKDDLLFYMDSGSTINPKGKKRFFEYIDIINRSDYGLLVHPQPVYPEYAWTTDQIFNFFNISIGSEISLSPQILAGLAFMKNCKHSNMIYQTCLNCLKSDSNLFTDHYSNLSQHKGFIENRHDQSIFSVVCKKHGAEFLKQNEADRKGRTFRPEFPFWMSRLKL